MPASLLPHSVWQKEIRVASEAGVSDRVLSERYGVPEATLRSRRLREKWLSPHRIDAERARVQLEESTKRVSTGAMQRMQRLEGKGAKGGAVGIVAETLTTLAEEGTLHFARLAHGALTRRKLLTVAGVSDACTLVKTLRSTAGLDKDAINITVGSWSAASMRTVGANLGDD